MLLYFLYVPWDVAQGFERHIFYPKTLVIPWCDRVRDSFFCPFESTLVLTNLCLIRFMRTASTQICAHVKGSLFPSLEQVRIYIYLLPA